jgi:hypothetical protein
METTVERIVIMPATAGQRRKNLQLFSVLRGFEQAQAVRLQISSHGLNPVRTGAERLPRQGPHGASVANFHDAAPTARAASSPSVMVAPVLARRQRREVAPRLWQAASPNLVVTDHRVMQRILRRKKR